MGETTSCSMYPAPVRSGAATEEDHMTMSRRTALAAGAAALAAPAVQLPAAQAAAPKAGKQVPASTASWSGSSR